LNRATRRTLEPSRFLNPDCLKVDGRGLDSGVGEGQVGTFSRQTETQRLAFRE
jgi:hypothetical protein